MILSIIAAVGKNGEIGYKNELLWHISADMKWFKKITSGYTVIMGWNTFESLGSKPLPKRRNIVLVPDSNVPRDNIELANSIETALEMVKDEDEVFVIGGASIYKQMLPHCQRMYLTHVYKRYTADTYFPDFDLKEWNIVEQTDVNDDEQAGVDYSFCIYQKRT